MPHLLARSRFHAPASLLADWHFRPGAFERLSPPWQRVEVVERPARLTDGAAMRMRLRVGPMRLTWIARHERCRPGAGFVDVQERGPFGAWRHEHRFEPREGGQSELIDAIDYAPPGGAAGAMLGGWKIRRDLRRLFNWRHERTRADVERHARAALAPRRVAITGAGGMIGAALAAFLSTGGHEVRALVRREPRADALHEEFRWWPETGGVDPGALEGLDAIIHLAGAPMARRWTARARREIDASRAGATRRLFERLARQGRTPPTVLCASGVGILAPSANPLDEQGPLGEDFPAQVARRWEAALDPARSAGARVASLRYGVVLSPVGGALRAALPLFRLGLGVVPGDGRQRVSWIGLDDAVGATLHALADERVRGAVHVVAPRSASAEAVAGALARALHRPRPLRLPAALIRRANGEQGAALLLRSVDAAPGALTDTGFRWRRPSLEETLRFELGTQPPTPGRVRFA